jgi:hypothetical protein
VNTSSSLVASLSWGELSGAIILIAGGLYLLFLAVDRLSLPDQRTTALVAGKAYHEAKQTYETELIAGRTRVVPHVSPEQYVLELRLTTSDQLTEGAVPKSLYEDARVNDHLRVTYRRRRLSGGVKVIAVAQE